MAVLVATAGKMLVMLTLFGTVLPAEEPRATLLGAITDPSGAVVAGARITAINAETAVRSTAESNEKGNYVIPYLAPGTYRLRVECTGFRTFEQGPIELRIDDRLRIDVTLRAGEVKSAVKNERNRRAGSWFGAAHHTMRNLSDHGSTYTLEDNA